MARTATFSILQAVGQNASLKEVYGAVIEGVRKNTLAGSLKNQSYSGNPAAGSVEYKRFVNSKSQAYGTARAANAGNKITVPPIILNIDTRKEIVEEVTKADLDMFGVGSIMARRAQNHLETLESDIDTAFFAALATAATEIDLTGITALNEQLEKAVQTLETVKNDYVTGVPRNRIYIVGTPAWVGKYRNYLDALPRASVDTAAEDFETFHGVRIFSSIYLPAGVDAIVTIEGAIGMPVIVDQYGDPEKIPLSNDWAVSMFYTYGVKVLTTDLVFKVSSTPGTLVELDVASVAGTVAVNDTIITVDPAAAGTGHKYVYKLGTTSYSSVAYNQDLTSWTDLDETGLVAAGTSTKITVAKVTTAGFACGRGIAAIVKKTS